LLKEINYESQAFAIFSTAEKALAGHMWPTGHCCADLGYSNRFII